MHWPKAQAEAAHSRTANQVLLQSWLGTLDGADLTDKCCVMRLTDEC